MQEMLCDRNAQLATPSEEAAGSKVDDAVRRGYITPGLKNWALLLCGQDPDGFDGVLSGAVPAFAHLSRALLPGGATGSPDEMAICARPGLPPGSSSASETRPLSGRPGPCLRCPTGWHGPPRPPLCWGGGRGPTETVRIKKAARWQP